MVPYPVHVPRDSYRGRNARRLEKQRQHNATAALLEKYVNERIAANPAGTQTYYYFAIASDCNLPIEDVRRMLFAVDCGHNGLTVFKPATLSAEDR